MKHTCLILVLSILCGHALVAAPALVNLHVRAGAAPGGDGSEATPFASLAEARDHLRSLTDKPTGTRFQVIVGEGDYFLEETFVLDERDSAPADGRIVYLAADGATPRISGGRLVEGWEPHENGIWKADVGELRFRQIYVAGQTTIRARQPNQKAFYRLEEPFVEERYVTIGSPFAGDWERFEDVEMHVTLLWAEAILRLKSFEPDPENAEWTRVRFQEPESVLVFKRLWPRFVPNQAFHFENAYEFIDQPGEWYHDEQEGLLYYMPRPGEQMDEVEVVIPHLENLVRIEGKAGDPVRGVSFSGLTFAHSNWLRPSDKGQLHMQAGQYTVEPTVENDQFVERIPAGVYASWAEDLRFEDNLFTQLGNHALDLHLGVTDSEIVGNIFYDVAASGIVMGVFSPPGHEIHVPWNPEDPREVTRHNRIANNYIRRIGNAYPGSCGIAAGYVSDLLIEHNELTELPYTGISVGWGWTREPSALGNNTIRRNHIHSLMRHLTDGGGIYTLSHQPGTEIYENHVHHAILTPKSHDPKSLHSRGIYNDEGSGGTASQPFIVRRNLIRSCTQDYREHITGAIIIDSPLNYWEIPKHMTQRPAGKVIAAVAGLEPEYRHLRKALPYKPYDQLPTYDEILSRAQKESRGQTGTTQQIVMTTELHDDAETIDSYEHLHSREGIWPEVVRAAEISGIEKIKIYRWENRLFMVIDIPEGASADAVFGAYDASSPRVKEWAEKMKTLQTNLPGEAEGTTWQVMRTIHDYEYGTVR